MPIINIAMIIDQNFIAPSLATIKSMRDSKNKHKEYQIHILAVNVSSRIKNEFHKLQTKDLSIKFIDCSSQKYEGMHNFDSSKPCVASISALIKFDIPNLIPHLNKILYLDGDIIVNKDLSPLYDEDVSNYYVAAVKDSGRMYYVTEQTKDLNDYFNSGVMLLNLEKMRLDNLTDKLIETKKNSTDNSLMDQNIFNIVMNGNAKLLDIKYNLLVLNLTRAKAKWNINDINHFYNTSYSSFTNLLEECVIMHFSSKEKPYNYKNTIFSKRWLEIYDSIKCSLPITVQKLYLDDKNPLICIKPYELYAFEEIYLRPCVSLIVCAYNAAKYIDETLTSLSSQTLRNTEIICVNDGSTDNTLEIMNKYASLDKRFKIINNPHNLGVSISRNIALNEAKGEYFEFVDADDYIDKNTAFHLYTKAKDKRLDMLFFKGTDFNDETRELIPNNYYGLGYYPKDFVKDVFNYNDCIPFISRMCVSTCLTFYKLDFVNSFKLRYPNKKIHFEDNYFFVKAFLKASRTSKTEKLLYFRRLHQESITHNWESLFNDYIEIIKMILSYLRSSNITHRIYNSYVHAFLSSATTRFNSFGIEVREKYYKKLVCMFSEFGFAYSSDPNYLITKLNFDANSPYHLHLRSSKLFGIRRGFKTFYIDFLYVAIFGIRKFNNLFDIVLLNHSLIKIEEKNSNKVVKFINFPIYKKICDSLFIIHKFLFFKFKTINYKKIIAQLKEISESTSNNITENLNTNILEINRNINSIKNELLLSNQTSPLQVLDTLKVDEYYDAKIGNLIFYNSYVNLAKKSNGSLITKIEDRKIIANDNYKYLTLCSIQNNALYTISFDDVIITDKSSPIITIAIIDSITGKSVKCIDVNIRQNIHLNFSSHNLLKELKIVLYIGVRGKTKGNEYNFQKLTVYGIPL